MVFDANSLYPSAMWDRNSVHTKKETGFAFKLHMNDVYVEAFNFQSFNQDVMKVRYLELKITIHLIFYFNSCQLKKKFKKLKLIG